jgi:gas vesicle protein
MGNFLLGLGIGITVGVLLAPKSGSETRKYIADKAADGTDYVTEQGKQLKDTASDLYERGRNVVNSQKDKIASVASSLVDETQQLYQQARRSV